MEPHLNWAIKLWHHICFMAISLYNRSITISNLNAIIIIFIIVFSKEKPCMGDSEKLIVQFDFDIFSEKLRDYPV